MDDLFDLLTAFAMAMVGLGAAVFAGALGVAMVLVVMNGCR